MRQRDLDLGTRLREEALGAGGKVSLSTLIESLVPVAELRQLAREHGLSPKGGFRLEKAPARVLAPLLSEPDAPKVVEEVCALLATHMTHGIAGESRRAAENAGDSVPDLAPVLKLKGQDLAQARVELEKSRGVAQVLRDRVDELTRQVDQDGQQLTRLNKEIEILREQVDQFERAQPVAHRDQSNRIQSLEKELEEQNQIELQQRIRIAEQAATLRDREERLAELEELVPKGRRRKAKKEPPPLPERFIVPHFSAGFLKSLAGKDRRAVEHGYRAVFLYCTEGSRHPGLKAKSLDPTAVWSLRASRKLRVYFRPRADGDIDVLELLDRQEQETALRRYREKQ